MKGMCKDCNYMWVSNSYSNPWFECRRYAPRAVIGKDYPVNMNPAFPLINPDDSCGEWEPAEEHVE